MSQRALESPSSGEGRDGEAAGWLSHRERGTRFAILAVFWWARLFGRWVVHQVARLIAFYYALLDAPARRASRDFLSRVRGEPATFLDVYRHLLCFARVSIDRIFLLQGGTKLRLERNGTEHLRALTDERRGAVLLGAHLGSFEALRLGASSRSYPVNIVGHFENARMINDLLARLDPGGAARVLHVGADPVGFALKARQKVEAGEMLAILADRVGLNDKHVVVDFLGAPCAFPTGPFILAASLRCPVYLVFGLYRPPRTYELHCEPFAEQIELPRRQREAALRNVVQRYAHRLEHHARRAPDNWFNFYDFWTAPGPQRQIADDG